MAPSHPPFGWSLFLLFVYCANGAEAVDDIPEAAAMAVLAVLTAFFIVLSLILILVIIALKRNQRIGDRRTEKQRGIVRVNTKTGVEPLKHQSIANDDFANPSTSTFHGNGGTPGYDHQKSTDYLVSSQESVAGIDNPIYDPSSPTEASPPVTMTFSTANAALPLPSANSPPPDYSTLPGAIHRDSSSSEAEKLEETEKEKSVLEEKEVETPVTTSLAMKDDASSPEVEEVKKEKLEEKEESVEKPGMSQATNVVSESKIDTESEKPVSSTADSQPNGLATKMDERPEELSLAEGKAESENPTIPTGGQRLAVGTAAPNKGGFRKLSPAKLFNKQPKAKKNSREEIVRRDSQKPLLESESSSVGDTPLLEYKSALTENLPDIFNEDDEVEQDQGVASTGTDL